MQTAHSSNDVHLLLHGHTHEAKADMLAAKVRVYSTGSASLKTGGDASPVPTDVPNQDQLLRIERTGVTRYCRQFAPRNTPPVFIADVRQSKNRGDWIIKDDANFSGVSEFTATADGGARAMEVEAASRAKLSGRQCGRNSAAKAVASSVQGAA